MIQYTLSCENDHRFEAWFQSAQAFDEQSANDVISCPVCASANVSKALMAPSVGRKGTQKMSLSTGHPQQSEIHQKLKELRDKVVLEADYVGDNFAEEARKIHHQEVESRGIYGEATSEEVSGLVEDGIEFMPLPTIPEEHN